MAAIVSLILVGSFADPKASTTMAASDPVASTTEPSAKGEDAAPSALPSKWTYNEQMDEMRGTVTKTARLTSSRSEEHTSELQSLMRSSYAVFCLKKKKNTT